MNLLRKIFPKKYVPRDGDRVRAVRLRKNNGHQNAYEGYEGVVQVSDDGKSFDIKVETSTLVFCCMPSRFEKFELLT